MYLNGIYGWHLSHRPFHQWQAEEIYTVTVWACCNSSLSHQQSVWAFHCSSEAQAGLLWPLYDMALHKIRGKELSASWHPSIADFLKSQSSSHLFVKPCRRCFDEPLVTRALWEQKALDKVTATWLILSPECSTPFPCPYFLVTLAKWSLQGSWLACIPSVPSACLFHSHIDAGSCLFLQAASLLPASPSCSPKHCPPLPYLLHLQAPQQTFPPASSRKASLPLPTKGLLRMSAMRLSLGDHLCCPDANSQCQLRSSPARLQEGSRHDFYCLRFYLGRG